MYASRRTLPATRSPGKTPADRTSPRVPSALETKAVDGQENPFNTILSSKFYEVQKYLTVTNHVYSPWIVLVSKKYWDGLSATEKKMLGGRKRKPP